MIRRTLFKSCQWQVLNRGRQSKNVVFTCRIKYMWTNFLSGILKRWVIAGCVEPAAITTLDWNIYLIFFKDDKKLKCKKIITNIVREKFVIRRTLFKSCLWQVLNRGRQSKNEVFVCRIKYMWRNFDKVNHWVADEMSEPVCRAEWRFVHIVKTFCTKSKISAKTVKGE